MTTTKVNKIRALQKAIGIVPKTEVNPYYSSKFFNINNLIEILDPHLDRLNMMIVQPLTHIEGRPAIHTKIVDTADNSTLLEASIPLPDNVDPQKMGSAITYYRRYALQSMLFLQAEDDDANSAIPQQRAPQRSAQKPAAKATPINNNLKPLTRGEQYKLSDGRLLKTGVSAKGKQWYAIFDNGEPTWIDEEAFIKEKGIHLTEMNPPKVQNPPDYSNDINNN